MMKEQEHIITSRIRRPGSSVKEFGFTSEMVSSLDGGELKDFRLRAWEAFSRLKIPTSMDEAWRRTDLRALPADTFRLPSESAYENLPAIPDDLLLPVVADQHGGQILLMPGRSTWRLDPILEKKGVVFSDLRSAVIKHPNLVMKMAGSIVHAKEGKFAALAEALSQNGVMLYIPRGVQVEEPLQSILWSPGLNLAHFSHILVWVDEGASVTYVHESASPDEKGHSLHSGVVEIFVAARARLQFVELQSWGNHVWNFTHERARIERDGNLEWIFGAVGSRLTKNFSDLDLVGEGATGRMSGFYFTDGTQHLDHDTQQNHLAPYTKSDLLFKGALKGRSRSVWQGMIYVAPGAQKTDGYQANRNLVLSKEARADSIPGLEILADDVRCTHGVTVGKIEQEPLFYTRSRGIPQDEAEQLIVQGFFETIMQRIPFEGVRQRFQRAIIEKTKGS
jgi:Fe-S cluster assembly protein SufD